MIRWFNVPSDDSGAARRPAIDADVEKIEGNQLANSPRFIVRVTADEATLDAIGAQNGIAELPAQAARQRLNSDGPCTIDDTSRLMQQ